LGLINYFYCTNLVVRISCNFKRIYW